MNALGQKWRGAVLAITLTNVSSDQNAIIDNFSSAQYEFEVWDVGGNPAPLTEAGEKEKAARHSLGTIRLSGGTITLHPGEQFSVTIDVARLFQIQPNEIYTVRVRRSNGLPDRDKSGKRIDPELSCTWVISGREAE